MKSFLLPLTLSASSLFLAATSAQAADAPLPAKEALCRSCHGAMGAKPIMDTYPKLNGQNKAYLIGSLKAYKTGERKGGMAAVMTAQAGMLTDAEMEALAEYYSKQ